MVGLEIGPVDESPDQWVEPLFQSLIRLYERLKALGFTSYNGKIVIIDIEEGGPDV